jgi:putative transcription factor
MYFAVKGETEEHSVIFGVSVPECTLCGKKADELNKIELEGSIVEVCDSCMKFGKVVETKLYKPMAKKIQLGELVEGSDGGVATLAPDYGTRVQKAREGKGLTREEFAKAINERESVIKRLEGQTIEPDEALVKKIERFLEIKLKEKYDS